MPPGFQWLESCLQDARYAFRAVQKRPATAALAAGTLTLALGLAMTLFSIVKAVLLEPLPYKDPGSLVMVWNLNERLGHTYDKTKSSGASMSPSEFEAWREESGIFDEMIAFWPMLAMVQDTGQPEMLHGYAISEGGFEALGIQTVYGRTPEAGEHRLGAQRVMVLYYDFWQRRFQSDEQAIGKTLKLFSWDYRIVGVLPPRFVFFNRQSDFLTAMVMENASEAERRGRSLRVMARLKPGMSLGEAQRRAEAFSEEMERRFPRTNAGWRVALKPVSEDAIGEIRPALLALLGGLFLVGVITCANIANLLLVQAASRQKELALRVTLGAGRWRLFRQLTLESLMLAGAGALGGLLLGSGLIAWVRTLLPDRYTHGKYLTQVESIGVDGGVAAFVLVCALAIGLAAGLIPALQAVSSQPFRDLKDAGKGSHGGLRSRRARSSLVVTEVALGILLAIGATLLVRSFAALYAQGPGLQPEGILSMIVSLPPQGLLEEADQLGLDNQDRLNFLFNRLAPVNERLLDGLEAIPAVSEAALTSNLPMQGWFQSAAVSIEGRQEANELEAPQALLKAVSPNYFRVVGVPLLRGETFSGRERVGEPLTAVVNDAFAQRYFQDEDPIGKRIKQGPAASPLPWATVIGVVGGVREAGMDQPPVPACFFSARQTPLAMMYVALRTTGDPMAVMPEVREAVKRVDPNAAIYRVRELEKIVRDSAWKLNYAMSLMSGLAVLAILLAAIGLYGVLSQTVRERTSEIGVRLALGAGREDILRLILGQGLRLVAIGIATGALAAMFLTRFLSAILFGVSPLDWAAFAAAGVLFIAVGLFAAYLPARRAMRIEPVEALRYE